MPVKKTIPVDYEEGEGLDKVIIKGTVTLRRLSFYETKQRDEDASEIMIIPGIKEPKVKVSPAKMQALSIARARVACTLQKTTFFEDERKEIKPSTAPMQLTQEEIMGPDFPQEIGDTLWLAFVELNTLNEKKNQEAKGQA